MTIILHKRCSKCGAEKPLTEFHKDRQNRDGLHSWCKACCHDYVYRDPEYRAHKLKYNAERRERMREQIRAAERERYHADPAVKSRHLTYEAARHRTDPCYRERRRAQNRKDKSTPQGRMRSRLYSHRRRVHARSGGNFTVAEWDTLCAEYDHRCLCCGKQKPLTVDHVRPLSKGGTNTIDNIQPLCLNCNVQKNAKEIDYRF